MNEHTRKDIPGLVALIIFLALGIWAKESYLADHPVEASESRQAAFTDR